MSNVDQSASKQGVEETGPAVIQSLVNNRLTLTMNRAHQKNVLSAEIIGGLRAGLAEAEQHDDVRMVVITNTGSTFCAGADLKSAKPAIVDSAKTADPTQPCRTTRSWRCFKPSVTVQSLYWPGWTATQPVAVSALPPCVTSRSCETMR